MAGFLRVGGIYAGAIVKPRTSSFFPSKIIRFDNLAVSGNLNLPNTITGRIDNDFLLLFRSHGRRQIAALLDANILYRSSRCPFRARGRRQ